MFYEVTIKHVKAAGDYTETQRCFVKGETIGQACNRAYDAFCEVNPDRVVESVLISNSPIGDEDIVVWFPKR